jgi:hypothetical protein
LFINNVLKWKINLFLLLLLLLFFFLFPFSFSFSVFFFFFFFFFNSSSKGNQFISIALQFLDETIWEKRHILPFNGTRLSGRRVDFLHSSLTMFYLKVLHILRPSKQMLVEIWISIHCLILNLMITKANEFWMWLNKFCGYLHAA